MLAFAAPSAASRPLALRRRADLLAQPVEAGGRRRWVIKDPLTLAFFELSEEEHALLELLDRGTSLDEMRQRFERRFAPRRLELGQLQAFLARLHEDGLVIADVPGQGDVLLARGDRTWRRTLEQVLPNLLALRWRGVDPTRFLDWLYPQVRWLFSPWALAGLTLLALWAIGLCLLRFDDLLARLPDVRAFFQPQNALWFAAAIMIAKVLHELGHALTCRHFGGECHELGITLLVFTPCLYCDVSDAWLFPQRHRRIAVSAAGMLVELALASACTLVWWVSEPGLLNSLCLHLMFVCSVGTLLFNGNPLMRYDGYYILADLAGVPNLARQASDVLRAWLARWFLGLDDSPARPAPDGSRAWLAAYAAASLAYRWIVVLGLLWFARQALKPYRLEAVADLFATAVLGGLLLPPVWLAVQSLRDPGRRRRVRWGRAFVRGGLLAAVVVAAGLVPLPCRVAAPVVLEPSGARRIYVAAAGTLLQAAREGQTVQPGETLAVLDDRDLRLDIARLQGQRDQQRLRLANLRSRSVIDPVAADEAPTAEKALADLEERLRRRRRDEQRLTLTAPVAGAALPPPERPAPPATPVELPAWSGTPLDERNLGNLLQTGTLVCLIGNPRRLVAVLVIDQADVEDVAVGQRVGVRFDQHEDRTFGGVIAEIARLDLKTVPREFQGSGDLPARTDTQGVSHPLSTSYKARVALDEYSAPLVIGGKGQARIQVTPRTLARRLGDWLGRTFRFQW